MNPSPQRLRFPGHNHGHLRGAAACLLAALLAAVAVRAAGSRYEERRRAFEAEAETRRKKLGLGEDRVKLFAQYPTPEVRFGDGVLQLAPGATATVRVSGTFPAGTQFLLASDDVSLLKETNLAGAWEAQVKVSPAALPGEVVLHVTAPVSLAESASAVISIRAKYALDVAFEDGSSAAFRPEQIDEGTVIGTVTFKASGEKFVSRTRKATLRPGSPVVLEVLPDDEDVKQAGAAVQAAMAPLSDPDYQKKQAELARKLEACSKSTPATIGACMEPALKEMQALQAKVSAKAEAIQAEQRKKQPKGGLACSRWSLQGSNGKVEGNASCAEGQELKLSGSIKAVP